EPAAAGPLLAPTPAVMAEPKTTVYAARLATETDPAQAPTTATPSAPSSPPPHSPGASAPGSPAWPTPTPSPPASSGTCTPMAGACHERRTRLPPQRHREHHRPVRAGLRPRAGPENCRDLARQDPAKRPGPVLRSDRAAPTGVPPRGPGPHVRQPLRWLGVQ